MLNSDGQFLSNLLVKSQDMGEPYSLSYDSKANTLLVGSENNKTVCVYRYITRQDARTSKYKKVLSNYFVLIFITGFDRVTNEVHIPVNCFKIANSFF